MQKTTKLLAGAVVTAAALSLADAVSVHAEETAPVPVQEEQANVSVSADLADQISEAQAAADAAQNAANDAAQAADDAHALCGPAENAYNQAVADLNAVANEEWKAASDALQNAQTQVEIAGDQMGQAQQNWADAQTGADQAQADADAAADAVEKAEQQVSDAEKADTAAEEDALNQAKSDAEKAGNSSVAAEADASEKEKAALEAQAALEKAEAEQKKAQNNQQNAAQEVEGARQDLNSLQTSDPNAKAAEQAKEELKASASQTEAASSALKDAQSALEKAAGQAKEAQDIKDAAKKNKQTADDTQKTALDDLRGKEVSESELTQKEQEALNAKTKAEEALRNKQAALRQLESQRDEAIKNARLEQLENEVAQATQALQEAKDRLNAVAAQRVQGSIGFFTYMAEKDPAMFANKGAIENLTEGSGFEYQQQEFEEYKQYTQIGNPDDATSLENMKIAFQIINDVNRCRQVENKYRGLTGENALQDLRVDPRIMATAQFRGNASSYTFNHIHVFNVYENLAWTRWNPYEMWYFDERYVYDDYLEQGLTPEEIRAQHYSEVGHYLNIVNPAPTCFGISLSTHNHTATWTLNLNGGDAKFHYTVEEFMENFNSYCDGLDKQEKAAKADIEQAEQARAQAQQALDSLKSEPKGLADNAVSEDLLKEIEKQIETLSSEIRQAKTAVEEANASYSLAKDRAEAGRSAKAEANAAYVTAQQNAETAAQSLAEAEADFAEADAARLDALRAVENAQANLDDCAEKQSTAQARLDEALEKLEADTEYLKALEAAQARLQQAEQNLSEAAGKLEKTNADYTEAEAVAKAASSAWQNARENADAAAQELRTAEKAVSDAEKALSDKTLSLAAKREQANTDLEAAKKALNDAETALKQAVAKLEEAAAVRDAMADAASAADAARLDAYNHELLIRIETEKAVKKQQSPEVLPEKLKKAVEAYLKASEQQEIVHNACRLAAEKADAAKAAYEQAKARLDALYAQISEEKPEEPAKPENPDHPTEVEKPAEPEKPANPSKPGEEQKPADENRPSEEPEKPAKPETPSRPTESEKPSDPEKPANPSEPGEEQKPADENHPSEKPEEPVHGDASVSKPGDSGTVSVQKPQINPVQTTVVLKDKNAGGYIVGQQSKVVNDMKISDDVISVSSGKATVSPNTSVQADSSLRLSTLLAASALGLSSLIKRRR